MTPTVAPQRIREQVREWRRAGERVAFVPTMGYLHTGHLALVARAHELAERVVVSIFVNPLQFGPGEDYTDYPRQPERDRERLRKAGVDAIFAPEVEALYPDGLDHAVRIHVPALEHILCGHDRPGHFMGVATVVAKLFNVVEPDVAVFGEKDYQQLLLVRRMVEQLLFPIDVVGVATVREADGLALSSRNRYLGDEERRRAPVLNAAIRDLAAALARGERDFPALVASARSRLQRAGLEPDYVEVRRASDLAEPDRATPAADLRVLAAARLGRARLIDNVPVPGSDA